MIEFESFAVVVWNGYEYDDSHYEIKAVLPSLAAAVEYIQKDAPVEKWSGDEPLDKNETHEIQHFNPELVETYTFEDARGEVLIKIFTEER